MHADDEGVDFGLGIGVVEAEHGDEVARGLKGFDGFAADALGGGVGGGEFGELLFEVEELVVEAVVFVVGDFGSGLDVVKVVVPAKFGGEGGVVGLGFREVQSVGLDRIRFGSLI